MISVLVSFQENEKLSNVIYQHDYFIVLWLISTNGDGDGDGDGLLPPMVTLYYAELFPLVRIRTRIPVQRLFSMVTVPILGTDLRPNKPVYMKFSCFCLHVFSVFK